MLPGHLADSALSPGGGELSAMSVHDAVIKHLDFFSLLAKNNTKYTRRFRHCDFVIAFFLNTALINPQKRDSFQNNMPIT